MKLIWNGHSCFTIQSEDGTLVLDPYQDGSVPGMSPLSLTADLVLCSHEHRDHGARETVALTGRTAAFQVDRLDTFHDDSQGSQRGKNTIHILSSQGLRVAHLGDLGCFPTPEQMDRLMRLDALLLPVGGYYTIDAQQAHELVRALRPRVVVPMHYRSDSFGFDVIARLEDFLDLCDHVVRYDGNTLELTCDTPAQTAVLTYQAGK